MAGMHWMKTRGLQIGAELLAVTVSLPMIERIGFDEAVDIVFHSFEKAESQRAT